MFSRRHDHFSGIATIAVRIVLRLAKSRTPKQSSFFNKITMTACHSLGNIILALLLFAFPFADGQEPLLNCPGPSRRKSWRYMGCDEREAYLKAVKTLNTNPPRDVPSYGAFVHVHYRNRRTSHGRDTFLPWHRWYIYQFERALRIAANDCSITLPYWDWELDAENEAGSNVLEANTFGTSTGVDGRTCASEGIASYTEWVSWRETPCVHR